jgi:hypothetical protein
MSNPNAINPRESMNEYAQRRLEQAVRQSKGCKWMSEDLIAMYKWTWMRDRLGALAAAVRVVRLTPNIRFYLEANDPQALRQLNEALDNLEGKD